MVRRIAAHRTLIIHIIRTAKIPILQSRASNALTVTTILLAGVRAVLPYSPLGPILGFVPLPGSYWMALFVVILGYCVLTHLVKSWFVALGALDEPYSGSGLSPLVPSPLAAASFCSLSRK